MTYTLGESIRYLDDFFLYFGVSLLLFALFMFIYGRVTPQREIALIREGNVAAAISYGGAMIGFSLPLASAVTYSVNLVDMLLFAIVATAVQLIAFFVARWILPGLPRSIEQGDRAKAIFLAALSIAMGSLNAAALVY